MHRRPSAGLARLAIAQRVAARVMSDPSALYAATLPGVLQRPAGIHARGVDYEQIS